MSANDVVQGLNNAIMFHPVLFGWIIVIAIVVSFFLLTGGVDTGDELGGVARNIVFWLQIAITCFTLFSFICYLYIQPYNVAKWSEITVKPYLKTLPDVKDKVESVTVYKVGEKPHSFYSKVVAYNAATKKKETFLDWMTIVEKKSADPSISYKQLGPDFGYGYDHGNYNFSVITNHIIYDNNGDVDVPSEHTHTYHPSGGLYFPLILFLIISISSIGVYAPRRRPQPRQQQRPVVVESQPALIEEESRNEKKISGPKKTRQIRS